MSNKYWFAAKRFGWGWGLPLTWQGWLAYGAYFSYLAFEFIFLDKNSHSISDTLYGFLPRVFLATIVLIIVCFKKGEPPRWRWGK